MDTRKILLEGSNNKRLFTDIRNTRFSVEKSFLQWISYSNHLHLEQVFGRRFTMKHLCEVLLFSFFVTALSNSTKLSSKPARSDNDTKHHPHCGVNNNYFYAGPNSKKIENMFSDIQQQLTKVEQEIRNIKKNQTCEKQDGKGWWEKLLLD